MLSGGGDPITENDGLSRGDRNGMLKGNATLSVLHSTKRTGLRQSADGKQSSAHHDGLIEQAARSKMSQSSTAINAKRLLQDAKTRRNATIQEALHKDVNN